MFNEFIIKKTKLVDIFILKDISSIANVISKRFSICQFNLIEILKLYIYY